VSAAVSARAAEVIRPGTDPSHQRLGIGSRIIRALLEEAERTGQDLVLDVLTVNRRAQARSAGGSA
jgi:ribosomal protein S18 acetylase RimI-like enzyme